MAPKGKSVQQPRAQVKQKERLTTRRKPSKARRGLKRKAQQEEVRVKRRRHNYNLRTCSGSVEFVSEAPYSTNKNIRRKYRRLGLDSALFHCKSQPARRKQSHISVVTVSSSDEEESMNRTAAWVASVQVDNGEHPIPEESSLYSDAKGGGEAAVLDQLSQLQIPSSPESLRQGCSISVKSIPNVTIHDQNTINLIILENPTLNSQESSHMFPSGIEDQVLSNTLQTPFCSVTADLNEMAESTENHSPLLTIKRPISPEFSHGPSSFYTSTPRRKCNSATENPGTFCVITPEWQQSSQEWKPIFSSRYKNNQTSPRSGINECTSSTINSNFVQNVELVNSQEHNQSMIDLIETESMSNVAMEIPQTSTPSTMMLFNNSNQRDTDDIHQIKPRKLFLFDSPIQSQNNDHERVDPECFYFGSQNPPDPTESETLTQENSSISLAEEFWMSGIVRMADENDKHSQESVAQDINDSSQNAEDDNRSLSNPRSNYSI